MYNMYDSNNSSKACAFISSSLNELGIGYDFEGSRSVSMKLILANYIIEMRKKGVRDFFSVCEEGVELWAAEIIVYFMRNDPDIRLHCLIPYEEQAAKWPECVREVYYTVLEEATDVTFIHRHYKEDCLLEARQMAMEQCGNIFALMVYGKEREFVRCSEKTGRNLFAVGYSS